VAQSSATVSLLLSDTSDNVRFLGTLLNALATTKHVSARRKSILWSYHLLNILSLQFPRSIRPSSLVNLAHPPTSSSLTADLSFRRASPHWNQLPDSISVSLIILFLIHLLSHMLLHEPFCYADHSQHLSLPQSFTHGFIPHVFETLKLKMPPISTNLARETS